jgi:hypothetical protein
VKIVSYGPNRRLRLLLLFLVCLSVQSPAADEKSGKDAGGEVIYNLTIRQPDLCMHPDMELGLALEIRNESRRTISIQDRATFYMTHFKQVMLPDSEDHIFKIRYMDSVSDPMPGLESAPRSIRLKPGESFRKNVAYKLPGDFFSEDGIYSMQLTYGVFADKPANLLKGPVDSYKVLFNLSVCEAA